MQYTKEQIIDLLVRFSKSDSVKHETSNTAHVSYSKNEHLILLKKGIEVCRISLINNKDNYYLRLGDSFFDLNYDSIELPLIMKCFNQSLQKNLSYDELIKII